MNKTQLEFVLSITKETLPYRNFQNTYSFQRSLRQISVVRKFAIVLLVLLTWPEVSYLSQGNLDHLYSCLWRLIDRSKVVILFV